MINGTRNDSDGVLGDTQEAKEIIHRPRSRRRSATMLILILFAIGLVLHQHTIPWLMRAGEYALHIPFQQPIDERALWEMGRFETGYRLINNWPASPEDEVYYTPWDGGVNFVLADGRPSLVVEGNNLIVDVYEFNDGCELTHYQRLGEVPYKGHLVRLRDTVINTSDKLVLARDGEPDFFVFTNLLKCGITLNLDYAREFPASP